MHSVLWVVALPIIALQLRLARAAERRLQRKAYRLMAKWKRMGD